MKKLLILTTGYAGSVAVVHGSFVTEAARDWLHVTLSRFVIPRVAAGVDVIRAGALSEMHVLPLTDVCCREPV